jgi:crotonobetainyl-CoA:carnitine CoA-transferase CaiB-like acyl-CoA transferase
MVAGGFAGMLLADFGADVDSSSPGSATVAPVDLEGVPSVESLRRNKRSHLESSDG